MLLYFHAQYKSVDNTMNQADIAQGLERSKDVITAMAADQSLVESIEQAVVAVIACLKNGGKVLFAGNGGSAADAQHMAAEFVARFNFDRPAMAAVALTTDTSALTAIGNDYGFESIFSRQVEALGREGDVLIAYSTSGQSPNILKALKEAQSRQLKTIAMTGSKATSHPMAELCDCTIRIPSAGTPYIQEGHLVIGHLMCSIIESKLFS